ncbi:MAG TPA: flagellar hook-associated protein FlgL [Candidatus Methylomirabilis sp.]|nr:flagellar hook-associated protein FlgL [Candidatus Methylomirabilis sp.]
MRVTENGLASQVLGNITNAYGKLTKVQEQLATSKRINRASDDPLGSSLVLRFQAARASLEEFQRTTDAGQEFLENTATALARVTDVLGQARQIAIQGSNDWLSGTRGPLAEEVNELLEEMVSVSNTRFADRYIFGGTETTTPPFSVTRDAAGKITAVTPNPQGINGTVNTEVAEGVRIRTNMPGDQAFTQTVDLFATLISLRDALSADDTPGIAAALAPLTNGTTQLNNVSGVVGVAVQRLEAVRTRNQDDLTRIEKLRSGVQDADIAELYLEMQKQQNAFEASLAAGAKALQMSLLDFLR